MTSPGIFRVRSVSRDEALGFLEKARQSIMTAEDALSKKNYHSASQEAIHGAISANDAALGLVFGIVPDSLNHNDAIGVFRQRFTSKEDLDYSKYLTRLITKRRLVMYEGRLETSTVASGMVRDAKLFLSWVEDKTEALQ